MPQHNQPHNPYASAAGAYGTNAQKHSTDAREVEARVLLKSAKFMEDMQQDWDNVSGEALQETLKYNRNIWMMFFDTAVENADGERPMELRNNIYSLANFVFKREVEILAKPEKKKLDILVSINRNIAAGLMAGIENDRKNAAADAAQSSSSDSKKNPPSPGRTDTSA